MDDSKTMARHDRKRHKLGQYAECSESDCSESDIRCLRQITMLQKDGEEQRGVICASCHARRQGRRSTEDHHVSGRANDSFTVPIPVNDHAILSDMQCDWPDDTLRNPSESPLRVAAAALRGWLNVLQLMIERTIGWIPAFLESADVKLRAALGESYWLDLDLTRETGR